MKSLVHFLKRYWPIVVLVAVGLVLFAANYKPGTYVVGWDNLFPEFNIGLNLKRSLFAIWQEYRGLGYEDGMSHAANLPHYLFVYLISFVLPQNLIRYVFIFLMHLLGGLGMFALSYRVLEHTRPQDQVGHRKLFALVAALFYQYNFAVVQMFYLPFEPFITHFGFLPWLVLSISTYIRTPSKKSLLTLAGLSLLSTPQAHVPTVFLVYLLIMGVVLLFEFFHNKKSWKHILVVILVSFIVNAYWGIPFALSTYKNSHTIANSKNNQMATPDIFLQNHEYGDLTSTALMRSFSLEFVQYDHTAYKRDYMLKAWKDYIDSPVVKATAWGFFGLALLGLVVTLYKKERNYYPYAALFIVTFLIIGNDIPVLSWFSYLLRTYVPLFQNVFRFVFTKFFIVYAFAYSLLLMIGLVALTDIVKRLIKQNLHVLILIFTILSLGLYTIPSFKGNFLHPQLRVAIPQDYFNVFDYFKTVNPTERIAILPTPWYWAWTQYTWGVIGSGFQWFGIEQPTIDVAFNPWNQENENFYWESNQAIYSSDITRLEKVLSKYDVSWLLVDEHIIDPEKAAGALDIKRLENGISAANTIQLAKTFGGIKLYKITRDTPRVSFVSHILNMPNIGPTYIANDTDAATATTYQTDPTTALDTYYPFRSLFTGKSQSDLEFHVQETDTSFVFTATIPTDLNGYTLTIPTLPNPLLDIGPTALEKIKNILPTVLLDGKLVSTSRMTIPTSSKGKLEIVVPKVTGYYSYNSALSTDFDQLPKSCNVFNTGSYTHERIKDILRLTSINSSNCLSIDLPNLSQRQAYLVTIDSENKEGRTLFASITNKQTGKTFFDTYLGPQNVSRMVIPPLEPYSLGYSINVDNISIGRVKTVNDLRSITVHQIPYDVLTQIAVTRPQLVETTSPIATLPIDVSHPNPAMYVVRPTTIEKNSTITLWQGFNTGWTAYAVGSCEPNTVVCTLKTYFPFLFGTKLTDHTKVNNWANGWNIPSTHASDSIVLYFYPQLLELIGIILLPLSFLAIFFYKSTKI